MASSESIDPSNNSSGGDEDGAAEEPPHWLDSAIPIHGRPMVSDVKALLRILPVFCVLPIFWTLFDQQGSVWTLQVCTVCPQLFALNCLPSTVCPQLFALN